MTRARSDDGSLVHRALALIAEGPAAGVAVASVLDLLVAEMNLVSAAFFVEDPTGAGVVLRVRRPPESAAREDELRVPAVIGGKSIGALGLIAASDESLDDGAIASAEGIARVLALLVRNDDLMRGLGDRLRELDRQSRQMEALSRIGRRIAAARDEGDGDRILVSEARDLLHADTAGLIRADSAGDLTYGPTEGPAGPVLTRDDLAQVLAHGGARHHDRSACAVVPDSGDTRDGTTTLIVVGRVRGTPFSDADLACLIGLADQASVALANSRLVSGLDREQTERRALGAAIVAAQETERRRVAEEIHDGPVQELVGVGLMLDALSTELRDGPPETVADVNRAAAAAREAVRALRRAISDLHPMSLEELGFAAAVGSLVERIEWLGARVELDLAAADALSETHRTLAFRVVQEGVANIVRHAEPHLVTIRARREGDLIAVEIRDDGVGFDPTSARPGVSEGHLGLAAAQERAALAGGDLSVTSSHGTGTTLVLRLPAQDDAGAQLSAMPPLRRASAAPSASSSAKRSSTTT